MTLHADFKETVFDSFSRVISLLRMECKCPNGLEQGAPQMDRGSQDLEDQTGLNLMNKQAGDDPIRPIPISQNDHTGRIHNSNLDSVKCSERRKSDLAIVENYAKEQGACSSNSSAGDTITDKLTEENLKAPHLDKVYRPTPNLKHERPDEVKHADQNLNTNASVDKKNLLQM